MELKVKKLVPEAKLPDYIHADDAAMNLYTIDSYTLAPGERRIFKTGIAVAIPVGYAGLIWDRSGLANKSGLKRLGGVVDAGYRGDIGVGLINLSKEPVEILKGDKVAQMIIQKIEQPKMVESEVLPESATRGEGGFGSTGR